MGVKDVFLQQWQSQTYECFYCEHLVFSYKNNSYFKLETVSGRPFARSEHQA